MASFRGARSTRDPSGGGLPGQSPTEIVLSGPDVRRLNELGEELEAVVAQRDGWADLYDACRALG